MATIFLPSSRMNLTKFIVPILLIAIIVIGAGAVYSKIGRVSSTGSTPLPSPSVAITEYKEYRNTIYGYHLMYPAGLEVLPESTAEDVSINSLDDKYWHISVRVAPASVSSPQEWLEQNKERYTFEGERRVGGYDAIVVYLSGESGAHKDEKNTVLIRDNKIFNISTRYVEHEKIWDSFSFQ